MVVGCENVLAVYLKTSSADCSKNTNRGSRNTTEDTRMVSGSMFQTGSGESIYLG